MKRQLLLPVLLTIIAGTLVSLTVKQAFSDLDTGRTQRRKAFETFLVKEYRNAPEVVRDKEGKAVDSPDMAAFQEYLMTMDPATGKVPREKLLAAYDQTRQAAMMKQTMTPLNWEGYGADMGGRTRAIMYDPNDGTGRKVWAGGVTGGLWYNNNIQSAYSSWIPVGDFWPVLTIRCITYDPNNTQTFYIGTGEPETALVTYRESSGLGQGIWRSTDGGSTWAQIPSTAGFVYITDILVRNESGNSVIYAGVVSGQYHGVHQSQPSDGLFRSDDNGASWTQVLPDITGSNVPYAVSDIDMDPNGRIYVGTRPNLNDEGGATLLFSDSGLPGSWVVNEDYKIEIENDPDYPIPGRAVLATSKSTPGVVYALIGSGYINPANNFKYFYCFHILRSDDSGLTWTKKNLPTDLTSGNNFATIAWHALDVAIDPNNASHLFIGGLDVHETQNGGNSWTRVSDWSMMYGGGGPNYIHADQHIIVFKPGSSNEVLFGSDGGVFYTANGNSVPPTFEEHNMNYNTLQFYSCAIHPTAGTDVFLGGLQDNGTLYYTGNPLTINNMVSGGDGAYCFYDQNDPAVSITSIYYNQYYIFNYGSFVNGLWNWSSGTFVCPADLDYKLNAIYANAVDFIGTHSDQILRLTDYMSSGTGTFLDMNTGSTVYFSALKYSPNSPSGKATLFVGTQAGKLYRAENCQSVPVTTEIGSSSFPAANISSIAIGNSDDTLLVTFSNYGVSSVWQTYNGGATWQEKEGNLPDMPIRWGLYYPGDARHALLATETGVWTTDHLDDADPTWVPASDGMANVRVDMLQIRKSDNTVIAASHGRGLFTAIYDISTGVTELKAGEAKVYPNPTYGPLTLSMELKNPGSIDLSLMTLSGQKVRTETRSIGMGAKNLIIDISSEQPGTYILSVRQLGKMIYSDKIVKL
jgi:hypothetical protein